MITISLQTSQSVEHIPCVCSLLVVHIDGLRVYLCLCAGSGDDRQSKSVSDLAINYAYLSLHIATRAPAFLCMISHTDAVLYLIQLLQSTTPQQYQLEVQTRFTRRVASLCPSVDCNKCPYEPESDSCPIYQPLFSILLFTIIV